MNGSKHPDDPKVADQEKLLRQYEAQLDQHYETFPLWSAPREQAIYAVLTVADAVFIIALLSGRAAVLSAGESQILKGAQEGVSQAIRWLTAGQAQVVVRSTSDAKLIDSAHHFTMFASAYVDIADAHMMYGREQMFLDVTNDPKVVTFRIRAAPGIGNIAAWHEQTRELGQRGVEVAKSLGTDRGRSVLEAIHSVQVTLTDGRICLGQISAAANDALKPIVHGLAGLETFPLADNADMLGFLAIDYRNFCTAVAVWSHLAFMCYVDHFKRRVPQEQCMPIQQVDRPQFLQQVAQLAQLDPNVVELILQRLTYQPGAKADIMLQPFLCGDGSVTWSPTVFSQMRHERNMLRVMARGTKPLRDQAANLIGSRERLLLQKTAAVFARYGYQYKLMTDIAAAGENTDVDVLLYLTNKPEQILLLEGKAVLAPDEISEVHDVTKYFIGAQDQLRRAQRILGKMPTEQKQRLFKFVDWNRVTEIHTAIITADAEPHSLLDPNEIPAIPYSVLRWRFRPKDMRSPARFVATAIERPWLRQELAEGQESFRDISVGDITYRLPVQEVGPREVEPQGKVG